MRQGSKDQCTGMILWDGMGWEVEGGSGWRTNVHPYTNNEKTERN